LSLFGRRKPLHERLAEQGGLDEPRPVDTRPWWGEVGIHGVPRPREWDAVAVVSAELPGERAGFAALPDGSLVVDDGPDGLAPLAEAVERSLRPPYRAEAVRRDDGTWSVGARAIRVVEVRDAPGDELQLTVGPDGRELHVDGLRSFGTVPALEELLQGGNGVVAATRLDGDAFEVRVHSL
jgi:hypothetical protein